MKKVIALLFIFFSFETFAFSVVDSMYTDDSISLGSNREPASQESQFCLVSEDQKVFAKSCYNSLDTCIKRQQFWKDLPGAKEHNCVKI